MDKLTFGPHSPLNGYLEYHSTWVRTKKELKNTHPSMYRILMLDYIQFPNAHLRGSLPLTKPGDQCMFYHQKDDPPPGLPSMGIAFQSRMIHLANYELKTINPHLIKNQQYTYHFKDRDPQALHDALSAWRKSMPLIWIGGCVHEALWKMLKNGSYKWTYEFQGRKY